MVRRGRPPSPIGGFALPIFASTKYQIRKGCITNRNTYTAYVYISFGNPPRTRGLVAELVVRRGMLTHILDGVRDSPPVAVRCVWLELMVEALDDDETGEGRCGRVDEERGEAGMMRKGGAGMRLGICMR
jgi:hypothetical protein